MRVTRFLVIAGLTFPASFGMAGTAIAAVQQPAHQEIRNTVVPMVDCSSGGLVDKKVEGSPVGVYGGGWINCGRVPGQVNTVTVEVTLRRDGVAVAYDKGACNLPPGGGGCSAGTPVTADPAGAQNWCADVRTAGEWGYSWSNSYCRSY